jgi:hypothetical protein
MKTLKLIAVLFLFSLQANATGYAHNMFVAHKKLQSGKEMHVVKTKAAACKTMTGKAEVKAAGIKGNQSAVQRFTNKVSGMVTLNDRILEEGPSSFFKAEEEKEVENSVVSKFVDLMKSVVYAFIAPALARS